MRRSFLILALVVATGLGAFAYFQRSASPEAAPQPEAPATAQTTAPVTPPPAVAAPVAPVASAAPVAIRQVTAQEAATLVRSAPTPSPEAERADDDAQVATLSPEERRRLKRALPGAEDEEGRETRQEHEGRDGPRGEHAFDEPEEFEIADRLIRTRIGGGGTEYAPNFRSAAQEALGLINEQGTFIRPLAPASAMAAQGITTIAEHGPGNVSGRTRAILPLPSAPATSWIVGSVGGGIWKTTNAGASWTVLTQDLASIAISSLAMSAADPNVIYAGTGEGFNNADGFGGEGIFKSTDGGVTWSQLASTTRFNGFAYVSRIIVSPNSPDSVVAATNTGIFQSVDGGTNWTKTLTTTGRALQVIVNPSRYRTQYAAIAGASAGVASLGVYKSTNGGATWTLANTGMTGTTLRRIELAIAPSDTARLYAQVEVGTTATRHYVTSNGGLLWTQMTGTATNILNGQGWYNNTIAVKPDDPYSVYVAGLDFYSMAVSGTVKTLTKRTLWSANISDPFYVHADHHNITVVPNGAGYRILNGSDGGVAYSDDNGVTWTKTLNGYNSAQPYGADKQWGADRFITGLQDNGTWVSPSGAGAMSSWVEALGGDGFFNVWHRTNPSKLLGSIQYNSFYRSTDGGATWNAATTGLADVGSGKGLFTSYLSKSTIEPDLVMTVGNTGIWRSADFGGTWTKSGLAGQWYPITSRGYVVSSPVDSRVAWASGVIAPTTVCTTAPGCTVMRSTDGGLNFSPTTLNGLGAYQHFVSGLAVHPTNVNAAYVLFSAAGLPKIMGTTDAGASWSSLTGTFATTTTPVSTTGFPNVAVYDLLVMPYDPNVMWAATEVGLVITEDGGASWSRPTFSFPNVGIWSLRIVDDQVVLATHGRGVWTIELSELATYVAPLAPGITSVAQAPSGRLELTIARRAAFDSVHVVSDGTLLKRFGANAAPVSDEALSFAVTAPTARVDTVTVIGYQAGTPYYSASRIVSITPPVAPIVTAAADGSTTTGFTTTGFASTTIAGHSSPSFVNTVHPYAANSNLSLQYNTPIIVAQTGATLVYDDIAHVEPCNDDPVYCATNWYDYVVVEATKNGQDWIQLAKYDSRYDAAWETGYASAPAQSSYRTHTIDLLTVEASAAQLDEEGPGSPAKGGASQTGARFGASLTANRRAAPAFAVGDTIFVRWRMVADGSVNGWGWTIDNIKIQENGVLPIELAEFGGVWDGDRVRLSWKTASETNNARFSVERETSTNAWTEIGTRAGAGTSSEEKVYTFDDARVPYGAERVRYRLRQLDFDGTTSLSGIVEVVLGAPSVFTVQEAFPNPVRTRATLHYALPRAAQVRIELFDVTGRRVALLVDEVQEAGRREVGLDASALAQGTYLVRISAGSDVETRRVSVVR